MSEFEGRVVGRLRYKAGDLFAGDEAVIAHGCNALGKMGKGFAYALAERYPKAKEAYLEHGAKNGYRLGEVIPWLGPGRKVLHLIVQQRIRQKTDPKGIQYVDYRAVESAFEMIERGAARHIERKEGFFYDDPRLAIPRIGADLGGGDWNVIERIISEKIRSIDVICYVR
ncbi:macro domain-containing protein [Bosea sp. ANAM02]|uniref:macro domain-containing protein n=1 Tax=Bosea sp. ANAM02 TaxID=2020412 RepID=UPI00140ECAB0|nr:macro domain-containing protein [Bosea sp. ANAM02]BCB22181.1 hypothetical protein OCUBac02_50750 [Bosea sp. ANAM02]